MPTHYRGSDDEKQVLDAYIKLMRASNSVIDRITPILGRFGLTVSQFGVLEALLHRGPMCQKDLAGKLLQTGGNMTMVLSNLEKRGLVQRQRQEGDRRYVTVALSEAGRALVDEVFPIHLEELMATFGVLEEAELARLGALCRRLGKAQRG